MVRAVELRIETPEAAAEQAGPLRQRMADGICDLDLVEQVRRGDRDAYLQLWERHVEQVRRVASTADVSPHAAEGAVNRAFSRMLGHLQAGLEVRGPFRRQLFLALHEEFGGRSPEPESVTNVVRAFRRLPVRVQTVLWYSVVEGLDLPEVAVFTGGTLVDVAGLLAESIKRLRAEWLVELFCDPSISDACAWLVQRADARVRGELGRISTDRFARHLATCPACTDFVGSLQAFPEPLRTAYAPLFTVAGPPPRGPAL